MDWTDSYPHSISASVLLLDGEIYNWRVGEYPWDCPESVKMRYSDFDKIDRMKVESKEFVVNNDEEHAEVFETLAGEWFRTFKINENHIHGKPYYEEV
jgi:hypothetical protein